MTARLMDAGRKLQARMRHFFDAPLDVTASPLELLHAALDQLERKVQPAGRGSHVFPYRRVVVHVAQPGADRVTIEAVFGQLEARLRERLGELRCELPAGFQLRIAFDGDARGGSALLSVECSAGADDASRAVAEGELPEVRICVVKGQCEHAEYTFREAGIAIGRGAEPTDTFGRMRRNHVAFLEVHDGDSETVARAHARLEFDAASRSYLLFNESRSNPTFVWRDGRSLRVAPRDPRGVRVRSGDQVQLGRAVLKLTVED
jgi:hypothetical protein